MDHRDYEFLERYPTVGHNTVTLANESAASGRHQWEKIARQSDRRPGNSFWKAPLHHRTQAAIGVNAYPLAPQISHRPFHRTAKANRFYVAMISGDGHLKSVIE